MKIIRDNKLKNNMLYVPVAIFIVAIIIIVYVFVKTINKLNNNNNSNVTYDQSMKYIKDYANKVGLDYNKKDLDASIDFGKINDIDFKVSLHSENEEQKIDIVINDNKYNYFSGNVGDSNAIAEFIENTYIDKLSDRILLINNGSTYNVGKSIINPSVIMYNNDGIINELHNIVIDYYVNGEEKKCNIEIVNDKLKYCQYNGTKEPGAVTSVDIVEYDDIEPNILDTFEANIQSAFLEE